jgi:hypothetical protein
MVLGRGSDYTAEMLIARIMELVTGMKAMKEITGRTTVSEVVNWVKKHWKRKDDLDFQWEDAEVDVESQGKSYMDRLTKAVAFNEIRRIVVGNRSVHGDVGYIVEKVRRAFATLNGQNSQRGDVPDYRSNRANMRYVLSSRKCSIFWSSTKSASTDLLKPSGVLTIESRDLTMRNSGIVCSTEEHTTIRTAVSTLEE